MDVLAAAHLHLAQGDGVIGGGLRDAGHAARDARAAAQVVVGPGEHLIRVVARVPWAARQELRLLGGIELPELRQDAAEPDLPRCGVDQAEGNKPADAMPVLGFDHKMGRGAPSNRSWAGPGLLPGEPVGGGLPARDQRARRPPGQVSPVKWRPPRWVMARAIGSTTTRVTLPQAPSIQLASAPIVNGVVFAMATLLAPADFSPASSGRRHNLGVVDVFGWADTLPWLAWGQPDFGCVAPTLGISAGQRKSSTSSAFIGRSAAGRCRRCPGGRPCLARCPRPVPPWR